VIESSQDIKNANIQEYEYVIIAQEKLASDNYLQSLVDASFDYMIVDEIHKLKNVCKGKRANALLQIAEKIEQKNGFLCLLS
jgi:replicative superfamily II helicase